MKKILITICVAVGVYFAFSNTIVKSQVKHTTIGQKVYKKYSPQNVQVNG